jgi:two-component system, NarL family, sensor kinase
LKITRQILLGIYFLLAGGNWLSAQEVDLKRNPQIFDSLMKRSRLELSPGDKAKLYNEIAYQYCVRNFDSALHFLELADAANTTRDERILCVTMTRRGTVMESKGDHTTAMREYKSALDLALKFDSAQQVHELYSNLMNLLFYEGNFFSAARYCLNGLALTDSIPDERRKANYLNLLGFIYQSQGQDSLSSIYYRKYFRLAQNLGNKQMKAHATQTLAEVMITENKTDSALSLLDRVLAYQQSVNDRNAIAYVHYLRSKVWKQRENSDSALKYIYLAISFADTPNKYDYVAYLLHCGKLELGKNHVETARKQFREALALARSIRHKENIRDAFYSLFQLFEKTKNTDSALYYFKSYSLLKDSLQNDKTRAKIAELKEQYDYAGLQNELKFLREKTALETEKVYQENFFRNILIVVGILVIAIFFLVFNRYHLKQNTRLQAEINDQQNEMFNTVISLQDKERKRIAEDLHDGLGSVLSAAKLGLERMEEEELRLSPQQKEKFQQTLHLLDEAMNELRSISHNLMPATLTQLGLIVSLQSLFDKISEYSGTAISFSTHNISGRFSEEIEISLYRVILELVNNTVKHADASEITLQLMGHGSYVNVTYEDNGKGFDSTQPRTISGIGLKNIFSRVDLLRGKVDIDSEPGRGTIVNIDLPLQ